MRASANQAGIDSNRSSWAERAFSPDSMSSPYNDAMSRPAHFGFPQRTGKQSVFIANGGGGKRKSEVRFGAGVSGCLAKMRGIHRAWEAGIGAIENFGGNWSGAGRDSSRR